MPHRRAPAAGSVGCKPDNPTLCRSRASVASLSWAVAAADCRRLSSPQPPTSAGHQLSALVPLRLKGASLLWPTQLPTGQKAGEEGGGLGVPAAAAAAAAPAAAGLHWALYQWPLPSLAPVPPPGCSCSCCLALQVLAAPAPALSRPAAAAAAREAAAVAAASRHRRLTGCAGSQCPGSALLLSPAGSALLGTTSCRWRGAQPRWRQPPWGCTAAAG